MCIDSKKNHITSLFFILSDGTNCHDWEFRCGGGTCIPSIFVCDAFRDCEDFSDEDSQYCSKYSRGTIIFKGGGVAMILGR